MSVTTAASGPIKKGFTLDYWDQHKVQGCLCDFCGGMWRMIDGYAVNQNKPSIKMIGCCFKTSADLGGWKDTEYSPVAPPPPAWKFENIAPPGGCICRKCNQLNPDAAPNEKEGTYVCFACR